MCGHHSFICPVPFNIFNTLNVVFPVVFVECLKTYSLLFEKNYLYLETASWFCSLQTTLGHQHSILKKGKMEYIYMCVCVCVCVYIHVYIYTHTHILTTWLHSVGSQQCRLLITIWNCKFWSLIADCCRIILGLVKVCNGKVKIFSCKIINKMNILSCNFMI
jgi:hypothetical protein